MPSEKFSDNSQYESRSLNCMQVEFTQSEDLKRAAEFDNLIFSKRRQQLKDEDVSQPTVDTKEYEQLVANGGKVLTYIDNETSDIVALCTVALNKDPNALEPMLQNMPADMAYMTVAAVREDYRGKGLGHIMLLERLEVAKHAGKSRAITTVHRSNVASMGNLIKAGFLGVGRLDNYYNLEDGDGERIVMYHGDLHNPNWHKDSTDSSLVFRTGAHLLTPDRNDLLAPLGFPEAGFCINEVAIDRDGQPRYQWTNLTLNEEQRLSLPLLVFPYDTLEDAYAAKRGLEPPLGDWPFSDRFIRSAVHYVELFRNNLPEKHDSEAWVVTEANIKKFFIDWVIEYREFIQEAVEDSENAIFRPSFDKATMTIDSDIQDLVLVFSHYQNITLWSFISEHLPQVRDDLARQNIRPLNLETLLDHSSESSDTYDKLSPIYTKQNTLLHQYLNAYYQDLSDQMPWPYNKEGFKRFRNRVYQLIGKRAINLGGDFWL